MKENYSIVLADDDPDDHCFFQQALNTINSDCVLTSVYYGSELLDYLHKKGEQDDSKTRDPHVIILDLNMPVLNGFETLKKIKLNEHINKIPVYILSTTKPFNQEKEVIELGAEGYYEKPCSTKKLEQIIAEILIGL